MTDTSRYFVERLEKWIAEEKAEMDYRKRACLPNPPGPLLTIDRINAILAGAPKEETAPNQISLADARYMALKISDDTEKRLTEERAREFVPLPPDPLRAGLERLVKKHQRTTAWHTSLREIGRDLKALLDGAGKEQG